MRRVLTSVEGGRRLAGCAAAGDGGAGDTALNVLCGVEATSGAQHDRIDGFGRRVTLTTYMDLLKSHESDLQIAVQMFAHGRLGFSRVWARGFRVTTQGTYRDLEEKELYEYT